MIEYFNSFTDELIKIARVPRAVKQYRRARQILEAAGPGVRKVFHGTSPKNIQSILSGGVIKPTSGTHGVGTYMWKNHPRQSYMNTPDARSPGFAMNRSELGNIVAPPGSKHSLADRKYMLISDKAVKIPARSSVKASPEQLKKGREGIKKHRLRQIDSAIWTRAEADVAAKRGGEDVIEPTKRELIRLLRQKDAPPKFKYIRSKPGTGEHEKFLESYDELNFLLRSNR